MMWRDGYKHDYERVERDLDRERRAKERARRAQAREFRRRNLATRTERWIMVRVAVLAVIALLMMGVR